LFFFFFFLTLFLLVFVSFGRKNERKKIRDFVAYII